MHDDRLVNYHTHTWRCKHADNTDEEYVQTAIANGYVELGFTDHTPWPYENDFVPRVRMDVAQLEDYLSSLRALREKYASQIKLFIGLECEYFPAYLSWLREITEKEALDHLILGNHFDQTDDGGIYFGRTGNPEHVTLYAEQAIEALETGLFGCLAHPDLILRGYPAFDRVCRDASEMLCKAAKRLSIPLEYNLLGLHYHEDDVDLGGLGYPYAAFWEIAADVGCTAIIGIDAHRASHLAELGLYRQAEGYLRSLGLTLQKSLPK